MKNLTCVVTIILTINLVAAQDEDSTPALTKEEKSQRRLDFLNQTIQKFSVRQQTVPETIARPPEVAAVRWINPQSGSRDGILSIFNAGGRPVCMAQLGIYSGGNAIHEFHVTSDQPFSLLRDDEVMWESAVPTLKFQKLSESPEPRPNPLQRTVQMRRLAAEFEVWDDHGWTRTVRQKLRLLPRPIYRYTDMNKGVIDGAVFSFALSNDPEAVLILEAVKDNDMTHWQYAFSPVTIYALEAHRNGSIAWSASERRVFNTGHLGQFVGDYRSEADDPDLKPLLPTGDQ